MPSTITSTAQSPVSAYIHIPFCRRRCYYCDFPVSVVGDRKHGGNSGTIQRYVETLLREIRLTPVAGIPLQTVFFGGGTPSLLTPAQVEQILTVVRETLGITADAEISIEMDPGTFDRTKLQHLQHLGIRRISLGVQAFQDDLLKLCGRSHTVSDIQAAIALVQASGIENYSLDLISGLPHQTLAQWQNTLETAIAYAPAHISVYDLIVEPQTAFYRYYRPGESPLPTDETAAEMYRLTSRLLAQAGYDHYEISNYARPGYACAHNRTYWQNRPYYGFGMGATSYVEGRRLSRPRKTWEYEAWVEALEGGTVVLPEVTASEEVLLETLMLGLRLQEGVDLTQLAAVFGEAAIHCICQRLQPYCDKGWVAQETIAGDRFLRLTDPEGFLFSNVVLASIFEGW